MRSILQCIRRYQVIATGLILAALWFAYQHYGRDFIPDVSARTTQFREFTNKAEESCSDTQGTTVSTITKHLIDRAAALEPDVAGELVFADYISLASVGSNFWPYARSHKYANRALEIAEAADDRIDKYSANLVLGHIAFLEFKKSRQPAHLEEGREYFKAAEGIVLKDATPQDSELTAQLYESWGHCESFVGNQPESAAAFQSAEAALAKLPRGEGLVYMLLVAKEDAQRGVAPCLPRPINSRTSLALAESPGLQEARLRIGNDDLAQLKARVDGLETMLNTTNKEIATSLRSLLDERTAKAKPSVSVGEQTSTRVSKVPYTVNREPARAVRVFNHTNKSVSLVVNEFDTEQYEIAALATVTFRVADKPLRLKRVDNGREYTWPATVFTKSDGNVAEPFIQITDCCLNLYSR